MFNNIPVVTKNFLLINILLFIATYINYQSGGDWFNILSAHYINSPLFEPYQLITHMFSHDIFSFRHILFNMILLVVFGSQLERLWGPKRYFIFYFSAGLGAYLLHSLIGFVQLKEVKDALVSSGLPIFYVDEIIKDGAFFKYYVEGDYNNADIILNRYVESGHFTVSRINNSISELIRYTVLSNQSMVGASGAIFGLLAAFGILFPNTELFLMFIPFPIKAKFLIGGYILLEIILSFQTSASDNIAHLAHVGGAIVGILFVLYWRKKDRHNFY